MGRKPKLFLPLTVTFFDDDRIAEAGDGPSLLYLSMCLKCKAMGTDGRLMENQIERLHRKRWRAELATLAALQLVVQDEVTREWCIAAWFGHNDSLAEIDARRAVDRERKAAEASARRATDSERNPNGIRRNPVSEGREGKGMKGKEGNPRVHRFVDDGVGGCTTCPLPPTSRYHLRAVGDAS